MLRIKLLALGLVALFGVASALAHADTWTVSSTYTVIKLILDPDPNPDPSHIDVGFLNTPEVYAEITANSYEAEAEYKYILRATRQGTNDGQMHGITGNEVAHVQATATWHGFGVPQGGAFDTRTDGSGGYSVLVGATAQHPNNTSSQTDSPAGFPFSGTNLSTVDVYLILDATGSLNFGYGYADGSISFSGGY